MTPRNYLYLLKKYDEYQAQIERLLESIVTSLAPAKMNTSHEHLNELIKRLHKSYPFMELLDCLNEKGIQIPESAASPTVPDPKRREPGLDSDRSNRVYYTRARENPSAATVTQPYLSSATHQLAISAVQRF